MNKFFGFNKLLASVAVLASVMIFQPVWRMMIMIIIDMRCPMHWLL